MLQSRKHLEQLLRSLPGIGTKQSERLVTAILEKGSVFANDMAQTLSRLHTQVRLCTESFQYFESSDSQETRSPIERDPLRDSSLLMIIEKDTDIDHIEKSRVYRGKYFVLGGLVPMLRQRTRDVLRLEELLQHIANHQATLREIILAFSFTPEGDHTRLYIETKLHETLSKYPEASISISVLGRGLAFGSEIEYSDPATIGYALEHRITV